MTSEKKLEKSLYLQNGVEKFCGIIGEELRLARKRRSWTISDVAQKIAVTPKTIIRLEKGDFKVALETYLSLLIIYGMVEKAVEATSFNNDLIALNKEKRNLLEKKSKKFPNAKDL